MSQAIQELKDYAESRYNEGFDVFVECNSDKEWAELLAENGNSTAKAKVAMCELAGVYLERQDNAEIEGGKDSMLHKDFNTSFDKYFS